MNHLSRLLTNPFHRGIALSVLLSPTYRFRDCGPKSTWGFDPKQRWISIEPLDRDRYSLEDRVCDFTRQLVAIHRENWEMA